MTGRDASQLLRLSPCHLVTLHELSSSPSAFTILPATVEVSVNAGRSAPGSVGLDCTCLTFHAALLYIFRHASAAPITLWAALTGGCISMVRRLLRWSVAALLGTTAGDHEGPTLGIRRHRGALLLQRWQHWKRQRLNCGTLLAPFYARWTLYCLRWFAPVVADEPKISSADIAIAAIASTAFNRSVNVVSSWRPIISAVLAATLLLCAAQRRLGGHGDVSYRRDERVGCVAGCVIRMVRNDENPIPYRHDITSSR